MEHKISELLIKKYLDIKRDLPWRDTKDPYKIWLSEVILQQTRVNQGMPYYLAFTERYPDVKTLAHAPEDEVLKLWQGLGYYSRARNMLRTAREVWDKYGNRFPSSYEILIGLKGIGEYTAAAVSSFSADEPRAVVDGNVNRVLSRLFGIREAVDSTAGKKIMAETAWEILDKKHPGLHNQALMELGALVCTPRNPACDECPVCGYCVAFAEKRMTEYPVKREKKPVTKRHFTYWLMEDGETVLLQKRDESDIWGGLYQFPLTESEGELSDAELAAVPAERFGLKKTDIRSRTVFPSVRHVLSHRRLEIRFVHLALKKMPAVPDAQRVELDRAGRFPFPVVIANFVNKAHPELFSGGA